MRPSAERHLWPFVLFLITCCPSLVLGTGGAEDVWVFLRDKGLEDRRLAWGPDATADELDLPVDPAYVRRLEAAGLRLRICSRWLNAVSGRIAAADRSRLADLDFVVDVQPLRRWAAERGEGRISALKVAQGDEFGLAFEQLAQIGVTELHRRGLRGQGVRIAVLDNGFHTVGHAAFARMDIAATRDFVNGDDVVSDEDGQPLTGDETRSSQNIHGAQVLSVLGGWEPGQFVGVAPEAQFLLAKTENNGSELPVEEDLWVAGLEWADSLEADIVNTSLGYNTFDDGSGYTHEDLDGQTAVTSRAAASAVRRGLILVVAAGNEGRLPWRRITVPADAPGAIVVGAVDRNRLIAPTSSRGPTADGRIKPDVVAPGVNVWAVDVRRGDYLRINGTSFAAPLVSGVCALLLQQHPEWGPEQMAQALRASATDLGEEGPDLAYGWGQVDALGASGSRVEAPQASVALAPFPNPASRGIVHFPLQLALRHEVELRIFDTGGALVALVPSRLLEAGDHSGPFGALRWAVPGHLASGVYFYQVRATPVSQLAVPAFSRRGKIALVRED